MSRRAPVADKAVAMHRGVMHKCVHSEIAGRACCASRNAHFTRILLNIVSGDRPWPFSCSPRDQHADLSVLTIRGVVNEKDYRCSGLRVDRNGRHRQRSTRHRRSSRTRRRFPAGRHAWRHRDCPQPGERHVSHHRERRRWIVLRQRHEPGRLSSRGDARRLPSL